MREWWVKGVIYQPEVSLEQQVEDHLNVLSQTGWIKDEILYQRSHMFPATNESYTVIAYREIQTPTAI